MKFRFHVVSLAHTQTTRAYDHCAYTAKVRKFCEMMIARGHEVFLYASEENEAPCTELVTCITKTEQRELIGIEKPSDNLKVSFDGTATYWELMNSRAAAAIRERLQPRDFVCLIGGLCQKQVADELPEVMAVEYGVGYDGIFAPYCVFESYAHMHKVYGAKFGYDPDGRFYDAVISNYYDPAEFPPAPEPDDYFLYIGRLTERKGYQIASDVAKHLGKRLVVAGQGTPPAYGEYVGLVDAKRRGELMSQAAVVFVPTLYLEPFGGVSAEAMLCGTPVITTDFGAFTELVVPGVTGYRCRTFAEFVRAAQEAPKLDRRTIRAIALSRFSMDVVAVQYEEYFGRLMDLWDEGWYQLKEQAG